MPATGGTSGEPIDLSGETESDSDAVSTASIASASDDGDLNEAIALSLQSMPTSPPPGSDGSTVAECVDASAGSFGGILGMDRKRQEGERLARLKRKREGSASSSPLAKRGGPSVDTCNLQTSTHVPSVAGTIGSGEDLHRTRLKVSAPPVPAHRSALQYPRGVVKKTWASGFEQRDSIKIDDVLQRSQLESAVLSSFQWDWDWFLPKLDTQRTKFVLVLQAKEDSVRKHYQEDFHGVPNVRLCFPSMRGLVNCMHSKLMLLFYPTRLRVVIPTANLVPYDWGEPFGGLTESVMENTVFFIDLSMKDAQARLNRDVQQEIPFLHSLLYFMAAMGLPHDATMKLHDFDFSPLAEHGFVHSIGATHYGDAWKKTGAGGLGGYLNQMGLRTLDHIQVDYITSSIGSLDDVFLRSLYLIAQGDSGLSEYTLRTGKSIPPGILQDLRRRVGQDFEFGWKQNFRIYFPSDETVRRSRGGASSGGTICFKPGWWQAPKFPRTLMQDCRSRRQGMLMHNKVIRNQMWFTRYQEPVRMRSGHRAAGWAYIGSANLSESAWGRLVQDRTTKTPKLSCRNWECGVVLPIILDQDHVEQPRQQQQQQQSGSLATSPSNFQHSHDHHHLDIFSNLIPIPMVVPGQPYPDDTDEGNNDINNRSTSSSGKASNSDKSKSSAKKMIPWFGL